MMTGVPPPRSFEPPMLGMVKLSCSSLVEAPPARAILSAFRLRPGSKVKPKKILSSKPKRPDHASRLSDNPSPRALHLRAPSSAVSEAHPPLPVPLTQALLVCAARPPAAPQRSAAGKNESPVARRRAEVRSSLSLDRPGPTRRNFVCSKPDVEREKRAAEPRPRIYVDQLGPRSAEKGAENSASGRGVDPEEVGLPGGGRRDSAPTPGALKSHPCAALRAAALRAPRAALRGEVGTTA